METIAKHFSVMVGDGSCILFWHDKWTGDVPLKSLYPHPLFADDTILFCDASREQILSIRLALTCLQAFTCLKVNVGKSEIVSVGEVRNIQSLAYIPQCRVDNLPMTYLGMPLGTLYKTPSIWNPIRERKEKKLSGW